MRRVKRFCDKNSCLQSKHINIRVLTLNEIEHAKGMKNLANIEAKYEMIIIVLL